MHSLDSWILGLGGEGLTLGLVVALLLGARHATDPDHLTAVSTLILSDDKRGGRRAGVGKRDGCLCRTFDESTAQPYVSAPGTSV